MALIVKDRVKESSTTTGTADFTLGGAASGFQTFAVIGNSNTTYYAAVDQANGTWEVGVGTYSSTGPTLTRDTVLESSNSGSKVNFAAGSKEVFCTYPAERSVYLDAAGSAVSVLDIGTLGVSTANITTANITAGTITTTPASGNDLVNKTYVDTIAASGIHFHEPVRVESPINLNATYNNGTAGVGATLTNAGTQAALVIDGITMVVANRVLVYQQTNQTQNGVYVVTSVGSGSTNWVLTRSADANTYGITGPNTLSEGSTFFVQQGVTGAGENYTCNTIGTITFGTTNITFAQISSAQIYSAGTGLTLSGTQFSITNVGTAGTYGSASSVPVFSTNAQGQVTSATPTAIAIAAAAVSGLAASATTDTTNAANITSGTLPSGRLNGSYTGITGVGTLTAGTWNASTIAATRGGTGLTSFVQGDLLYATSSTTVGRLADAVAGNALISGGVGGDPAWGKIGLTTHVSGTLPVGNGGTGATTLTGYVYGNGTGAFTASTSIPNAATTATNLNTASAIVARDGSGNFSAGTITAALNGNASTATTAANVNNGTLSLAVSGTGLSGSATFTANQSGNSTFTVASNATNLNTVSTIVARDSSGNFSAGTVTAALSGNATTATTLQTARNIGGVSFNGSADINLPGVNTAGNQNTSGTAANVTGTVAIANGGTGQTTAAAAITALTGTQTSGQYLRSNGTAAALSAIQAADVPTLNQNTTGTAANVTGTVAIANGGTGATTAAAARTNLGATTLGGNVFTVANVAAIAFPRFNADNTVSTLDAASFRTAIGAGNGTVTSVAVSGGTTGLTTSGGPITTSGTITLAGTLAVTNGGTGATTNSAARTNLGATTLGGNLFTIANVAAIAFPRFNADNTVSSLDAASFRTAIGAGTSSTTGTVTSVATSGTVSGLTLTGGTITTTGTITLGGTLAVLPSNFASQTANTVLAAPNGSAGVPTFRAIVAADIPTLNQNTTGTAANVTGTVAIANGGTGSTTAAAARTALGATTLGSNLFTVTNPSAITFPRFNADNTISSLDAASFRTAIGAGTSSTTGTVTSVGGTGTVSGLTLSGTVTTSGNLTLGGTLAVTPSNFASQTAKTVLAAPNAAAGVPTFRLLVASDIPTLNQNTTGTAANVTGTVAIANGGTGATTRQNAMDELAGAVTSGQYLRGNGTDVVMSAIQAADVPTLNQSTTGGAATVTGWNAPPSTGEGGGTWPQLVGVKSDGLAEVGRYLDFHGTSNDGVNFTVRLDAGGTGSNTLTASGNITANASLTSKQVFSSGTTYGTESNFDVTNTAVTLANTGFIDMSSYSGMLVINNQVTGGVSIWLCGGGNTSQIGTVSGGAGMSVTYNSGINGYTIQNFSGVAITLGIFKVRTRDAA